jgi:hypothetical protein
MKWIALLLALFSTTAVAEHRLDITLGSYHFSEKQEGEWNEVNPGLIYTYSPAEGIGFSVGRYRNSFSNYSNLAGLRLELPDYRSHTFGILLGGVTGYQFDMNGAPAPVSPLAAPYVTLYQRVNVSLQYAGRESSVGISARLGEW